MSDISPEQRREMLRAVGILIYGTHRFARRMAEDLGYGPNSVALMVAGERPVTEETLRRLFELCRRKSDSLVERGRLVASVAWAIYDREVSEAKLAMLVSRSGDVVDGADD